MKRVLFVTAVLAIAGCLHISVLGQGGVRTSTTAAGNEADLQRRMQDMRALDSYARRISEKDRREMEAMNQPQLDKKAKDRIRAMRAFDTRDIERYKSFLADKKTGIFKLFPNFDCLTKVIVNVGSECSKFVPESSDFSFRSVAYTHPLYHDIGFVKNELVSDSFFSQGVMAAIGDVPIEQATLDLPAARFLLGLKPDTTIAEAKQNHQRFDRGVALDGLTFASNAVPAENTTYILRNIAYRLENSLPMITRDSSMTEMKFKSLEMDDRYDVVVAFRIVRKDENGGLTIVWKELSRTDAPKLKFRKGEALADFR